jgi:hypothetical protein
LQFHFKKWTLGSAPSLLAGAEITHSDASIIGANFSYVAGDVATGKFQGVDAIDLGADPPGRRGPALSRGVAAKIYGADPGNLPHRLPRRHSWGLFFEMKLQRA